MKSPRRLFKHRPSRDEWRISDVWDEGKRPIFRGTLDGCARALLADATAGRRAPEGHPECGVQAYWIGNLDGGPGGVDAQVVKCGRSFHLLTIIGGGHDLWAEAGRIRSALVRAGGDALQGEPREARSGAVGGSPMTRADAGRVAALLKANMGDAVACYRAAVAEGRENPVVMILARGNARRDAMVEVVVEAWDMAEIESRAIGDANHRLLADQIRAERKPGCFALVLMDEAGTLSVASVPVAAAD
jgi:hypothetical protein